MSFLFDILKKKRSQQYKEQRTPQMGGKATVETPQRTKERPISWDWAAQRRYGGKMVGKEHRHKK